MMKSTAISAFTSLLLAAACFAQGTSPGGGSAPTASADPIPTKFWKASTPGGDYMIGLSRISSVAKHTYVSDGAVRVFEVTIADESSAIARFYYLEPVTNKTPLNVGQVVIERSKTIAKEVTKRAGQEDAWYQVVKNYPATTHAKTIEYRLASKANIDALYTSITRAWERGKGERFTIRTESE